MLGCAEFEELLGLIGENARGIQSKAQELRSEDPAVVLDAAATVMGGG